VISMYRRVGIIGGTGKMGSWVAELFKSQALEVIRCGRSTGPQPRDLAGMCDVIVISVPIRSTIDLIKQVGPLIPKDGLLMDLTSIKTEAMAAMLRYSRSAVVGLHPLFGPKDPDKGAALKVAVCPGRGEQALDWTVKILEKRGLKALVVSPLVHDRLMGVIQGVHHLAMVCLGLFIARSHYSLPDLIEYATPSFAQTIERIQAILCQPSELFGPLVMDNPFSSDFMASFVETLEDLQEIISNKDMVSFHELFTLLRRYFTEEEMQHETGMGKGGSLGQGTGYCSP